MGNKEEPQAQAGPLKQARTEAERLEAQAAERQGSSLEGTQELPEAAAGSCFRSRPKCVSKSWEETIHTTMCRGFVTLGVHEDL